MAICDQFYAKITPRSSVDYVRLCRTMCDLEQFRHPIALRTDLSHVTMELCEIPVFSPADGAWIFHNDYLALLFGVIISCLRVGVM